ncbi:acetoacetate--CoA ligase [Candidatus Viridilinea mediisalina]|uniref:Acetoacetate--CoA ligase n=1 Tax=Candidatus Viridilinea mediisalina TaxID=2024553 RepID=A0A2A6RPC2_9CHLR|nr:acetoacetate--CoA ligase [Candidatus Viridilinea mediisalina]PDW04944.1 acetoacetate--CoA ligase [Candidatus Viridilinea mediisalina]
MTNLLWSPSRDLQEATNLWAYMAWLRSTRGLEFANYDDVWRWSVAHVEDFWASIWDYFQIQASRPYSQVLGERHMPGAQWFPGAHMNYVEHVFRQANEQHPALVFQSERQALTMLSWAELRAQVAAVAATLRELGVEAGDRVVGYVPNIPQALVAFLASASLGAIWSSCSPDFGSPSVIDRFRQIEPKVLVAVDGYSYGGKAHERYTAIAEIQAALPSLQATIFIPYLDPQAAPKDLQGPIVSWASALNTAGELQCVAVPFDHPLWVLYSSGTTGLPKPIVQSQGGILIQHLKELSLHLDLKRGERFFWFSTTGWMMWNLLVGGLLVGSTIVLYDGSPGHPDMGVLWKLAETAGITFFGTSAGYLTALMKSEVRPGAQYNLSRLKGIGSTGSPLPPEGFAWVYEQIKADVWLASISGGTDICGCFVAGTPLLPVYSGEIQCRALGVDVQALDSDGNHVIGSMGELVVAQPMPSMPIYFWNDPDGRRYRESYFELYPGKWRHGDWIVINERGGVVIYGRSDSTINRQGVRMGSSEIYRVVEALPEVLDSLVVDLEGLGGTSYMPLFVVLRPGLTLDAELTTKIKGAIRSALSPRHVPDAIFAIPDVPRTLSGKKLEVPIKKIMMGMPVAQAANPDSLKNPELLSLFVQLAQNRAT